MKKTILITGGAGYIGAHAVVAFEKAGYRTVIVDNFANSDATNLRGIEKILWYAPDFYECDITDKMTLDGIFQLYHFDGVLHFAGLKAVGESCEYVEKYQEKNIFGSIVLFGTMEKYGVKKLIFSSSATVYDVKNQPPFTEEMTTNATNPYGNSKLVIEKLIADYTHHKNWSAISLRYFNPIGAHESGEIGEKPNGVPNNLLPFIFDVALGKREKVMIFGDDYTTHDGTGIRDYIDVNDVISAHLLAYEHLSAGMKMYNIGTGVGTSVLEMIHLVEKITKKPIPYTIEPRRAGDVAVILADAKKIQAEIAWKPQKSLSDAILTGWEFVKKQW